MGAPVASTRYEGTSPTVQLKPGRARVGLELLDLVREARRRLLRQRGVQVLAVPFLYELPRQVVTPKEVTQRANDTESLPARTTACPYMGAEMMGRAFPDRAGGNP